MNICRGCGCEFRSYCKIDGKLRSLQKRKFCLTCSPFNSDYNKPIGFSLDGLRVCSRCRNARPDDMFRSKGRGKVHSACKECLRAEAQKRNEENRSKLDAHKRACVAYKGGKCQLCGYSRCIAALDFHHRNPKTKRFQIAVGKSYRLKWSDIFRELDSCDLLCSNCHRELHWSQRRQR